MFNQAPGASGTGNIFGKSNASSGSLFGTNKQATTGSFSLSGNNQTPAPNTNAFTAQQNDLKQGGMFQNNLTTNTANTTTPNLSGGLFGNNNTAQNTSTSPISGGLFGKQTSFGTGGGVGGPSTTNSTLNTSSNSSSITGLTTNKQPQNLTILNFNNQGGANDKQNVPISTPSFGDIGQAKGQKKKLQLKPGGLDNYLNNLTNNINNTNNTNNTFQNNTMFNQNNTTNPTGTSPQNNLPAFNQNTQPTTTTPLLFNQNNQTSTQSTMFMNSKPAENKSVINLTPSNQTTTQQTKTPTFSNITATVSPILGKQNPKTGMEQTKLINPLQQNTQQTQVQSQPQTQAQTQNQIQKLTYQFQKSNKTVGEYADEWRKLLIQSYRQLAYQCQIDKSYYNQRKENYTIIKNFAQLDPIVNQNKKTYQLALQRIQKKQKQIMNVLSHIKQELGNDTNTNYYRQHPIASLIQGYRNARKQVNAQDEKFAGGQQEDPSNQQLRNIFFNLDSVENQIRRLSHLIDHHFGKITL